MKARTPTGAAAIYFSRLLFDGTRYAVSGEDDSGSRGYLGQLFDEDRTELPQALDHVTVVNHLVAHIDRRTEKLNRPLDDVDGAVDAGTEAAWIGEQHLHHARGLCAARDSRQASTSSSTAPMVMAESAMLNAGK